MSNCSKCGSGSHSSTNCQKAERKFFIAEVEETNASTCEHEGQCEFNEPFFDTTKKNTSFTIPSVGSSAIIQVCDNSRWSEGQWIYIPNAGRFNIIAKDGCSNIYIRNGCGAGSNAEAIPGNSEPGKTLYGPFNFWPTADPGCGGDPNSEFCNNVLDAIADCDQDLCKYLEPVEEEDNYYRLAALTHTGDEEGLIACFRKAFDIIVKNITLCFPRMAGNSSSSNDDGSFQDVQWTPQTGCLVRRNLPQRQAVDIYCGGKKEYLLVPTDFASKKYHLTANQTTGCPQFEEYVIPGCDIAQTRHPKTLVTLKEVNATSLVAGNVNQTVDFTSFIGDLPTCAGDPHVEIYFYFAVDATGSGSCSAKVEVDQGSYNLQISATTSIAGLANHDSGSVILKVNKATPSLTFKVNKYAGGAGSFYLKITGIAVYY